MVDINKYLENQLALAKKHTIHKVGRSNDVSEISRTAAEKISRKEDKQLFKKNRKINKESSIQVCTEVEQPSTSKNKNEDDESDYLPSCDEDDDEATVPSLPSTSRPKKNLKKIVDDGDRNSYDNRIKEWRENLEAARTGNLVNESHSADIQYLLDGNKDVEKFQHLDQGLRIPIFVWKQLYKYQRTGVKWLWELHQVQSGGLLGDEMGLGKTVQIIAFLAGLSNTDSGIWGGLGPSIIVAPCTVIYQWVSHFHYWCPYLRIAVLHNSGSHSGNHNKLIRDIHHSHGILLITYAGVVKYSKDLLGHKWHYIILDEGHKIRNPDTQVSKHVKKFDTPHKLLITGSPMQNSLQELWSLFDFMSPGLLGTHHAFMEYFANPITQGGYANATELQEATALEIAIALKKLITPYMLRRTKAEVQEHIKLPEKNEQVLFCALSEEQRDLYMGYLMGSTVRSILDKESRYGDPIRARVLVALSTLRKICNHPDLYLYEIEEDQAVLNDSFGHWKRSGKMTVVNSLLKIWQKQGHRTLIFSQSRAMICILEQFLQNHNYKYLKMDGTVIVSQRQNLIKTFNENPEYLVFLSTTRVGGLGVNLTGADRVIIYDPDWNPATDNQAKERAWRIGQEKNVTVYRLLSAGTIEEKIYQRQIFKHFLSNRILVDPNQKNVLTTSTLQGLFTLDEPNHDGDTETASLFKHTKVNMDNNHKKDNSGGISNSKKKIEAMKRMAKEISKRISKNVQTPSTSVAEVDPRERYKRKRELLLNPPKAPPELEINLMDDKITTETFDNVMSELDIINMHAKENYEENLIQEVLSKQNKDNEKDDNNSSTEICNESKEEGEINSDSESRSNKNNLVGDSGSSDKISDINHGKQLEGLPDQAEASYDDSLKKTKNHHGKNRDKKRKRKDSSVSETEIDSLLAVKKVKRKKHKHNKEEKSKNDDDYVLNKLFAKASVKSALQHDAVVGLAEKEKRLRLKEEASKVAKTAVRAIKFSSSNKLKKTVQVL
ncbi:DNA excision repair protein ERCC-6-like [Ostrinia furnacalis]|uniref:DNA excision repair protein ERCC-6-like n=1 Tax=Ostrinia furnacalis TaxID=93504 RepID=UPI00103FF75E|nr:DNA excision repair protein ERCC-6-like [Ostrinia furnacalis]